MMHCAGQENPMRQVRDVIVYDREARERRTVRAELEVYETKAFEALATKAFNNKSKTAVDAGGAMRLRILKS